MSVLSKPYFHDEAAAFAHVEARLWPNGPTCPHCGALDRIFPLQGVKDKKGRVRIGLKKCGHCRKQFTVRVGTVLESSHIPVHKWLQIIHLMCSSKKGVSAHQLHRTLEISYKAAWFAAHRIREAMRDGSLGQLGGAGKIVEADETYFGKAAAPQPSPQRKGRPYKNKGRGPAGKRAVVALVERGGAVRSFHVDHANKATVANIVTDNIVRESILHTDESRLDGSVV